MVDFHNFFDGEDLTQEDLVAWINVGMHHLVIKGVHLHEHLFTLLFSLKPKIPLPRRPILQPRGMFWLFYFGRGLLMEIPISEQLLADSSQLLRFRYIHGFDERYLTSFA